MYDSKELEEILLEIGDELWSTIQHDVFMRVHGVKHNLSALDLLYTY